MLANCGEIDPESLDDYVAHNGYKALQNALNMSPEAVINEMSLAGLRGRGARRISTWKKWELCKQAEAIRNTRSVMLMKAIRGRFRIAVLEGDPRGD